MKEILSEHRFLDGEDFIEGTRVHYINDIASSNATPVGTITEVDGQMDHIKIIWDRLPNGVQWNAVSLTFATVRRALNVVHEGSRRPQLHKFAFGPQDFVNGFQTTIPGLWAVRVNGQILSARRGGTWYSPRKQEAVACALAIAQGENPREQCRFNQGPFGITCVLESYDGPEDRRIGTGVTEDEAYGDLINILAENDVPDDV